MRIEELDQNFIVTAPNAAQTVFFNALQPSFSVHGLLHDENGYFRIPQEVAAATNIGVKWLYLQTAGERIHFHGLDRSDYLYLSDSIYWIEAAAGGKHSVLHTANDTVEIMGSVASLEKQYAHLFLRCHQSYLINPHFLRNIRRFELTLTDGTVLPIPEKKYTAFRALAMRAIGH